MNRIQTAPPSVRRVLRTSTTTTTHPVIRKPTVVFYPDSRIMAVPAIASEVNNAGATFHADCSEDLLERCGRGC